MTDTLLNLFSYLPENAETFLKKYIWIDDEKHL